MNPFRAFLKTHCYLLTGRLHFPKERVGETFTLGDDQEFMIFRQVIVDPPQGQRAKPGALFRVRFRVANMTPEQNKHFSILPIPFITGLPGFRSKLWMHNHATGESQGVYQWDRVDDARNYANSFAMKFMTRRAVPGSISHEVRPLSQEYF
jgi:hypothetical protein